MPPSLRRRGQSHHIPPPSEPDDSDHDVDDIARQDESDEPDVDGDVEGDELVGLEDDEEEGVEEEEEDEHLEEDEEALASPSQANALPNLDPPPPYLREISTLASWTVSSSKPGCSIPQLRHPNTNLFWQSDGPQPHYLNIHFFKLVRIVGLRLYLDFEQDESYTPTRIIFLAGSSMNDLQEWGEMRLESPRGWVWADFSGVGDVEDDDDNSDDEDNDNDDQESPNRQHQRLHLSAPSTQPNGTQTTGRPADGSSDSENAAPFHTPTVQQPDFHTPVQTQNHNFHTTPLPPTTQASQPPIPSSSFDTHTPSLNPIASTPSLPRPSSSFPPYPSFPRTNSNHLFTPQTPHPPSPHNNRRPPQPPGRPSPQRQRAPKMPVLRAHLLQIKILENHQNGKDTHLRGLQVFAKNEEDNGTIGAVAKKAEVEAGKMRGVISTGTSTPGSAKGKGRKGMGKGDDTVARRERRARREREERLELGGGIGGTRDFLQGGGDIR